MCIRGFLNTVQVHITTSSCKQMSCIIVVFYKSLDLLPSTTKIAEILAYLENVMEHQATRRRENQVLKSMFYAENLQVRCLLKNNSFCVEK